jgi:hypothetical protein
MKREKERVEKQREGVFYRKGVSKGRKEGTD